MVCVVNYGTQHALARRRPWREIPMKINICRKLTAYSQTLCLRQGLSHLEMMSNNPELYSMLHGKLDCLVQCF